MTINILLKKWFLTKSKSLCFLTSTNGKFPSNAAICKALSPPLLKIWGLLPHFRSSLTISTWPHLAASSKAVLPGLQEIEGKNLRKNHEIPDWSCYFLIQVCRCFKWSFIFFIVLVGLYHSLIFYQTYPLGVRLPLKLFNDIIVCNLYIYIYIWMALKKKPESWFYGKYSS